MEIFNIVVGVANIVAAICSIISVSILSSVSNQIKVEGEKISNKTKSKGENICTTTEVLVMK